MTSTPPSPIVPELDRAILALARCAHGQWGYAFSGALGHHAPLTGCWSDVRGVRIPIHELRRLLSPRMQRPVRLVILLDADSDARAQLAELRCRLRFGLAGRVTMCAVIHQSTRAALARSGVLPENESPQARALAVLATCSPNPHWITTPARREPESPSPSPEHEALLTRGMLGDIIPVSDMGLWRWLRAGKFPAPIKFNGRNYWRASEVQAWIDARAANRATEKAAAVSAA